jgi:hypothetical protein
MKRRREDDNAWAWLTKTWLGPVLSLIVLVSAPMAFVEKRGFAWTFGVAAVATWFWWSTNVLNKWDERTLFEPRKRRYSWGQISLRMAWPIVLTAICLAVVVVDVEKLNIWRQDYPEPTLEKEAHGDVNKFFGDTAPRTTPAEIDAYDQAEWVRWLEAGAQKQQEGAQLLFVKARRFTKRYHTFVLDVHDLGEQVKPCKSGVAFLVTSKTGDIWKRRTFRQVTCDFASDGATRLYRVVVDNPDPGEQLWLFLCVTPTTNEVNLDALNLQLMVR